MTEPSIAETLAEARCQDVHGDTYTAPWCHSCRGWAETVASVLEAREARLLAQAWETGHMLGEALAYNALGDILWAKHRAVIVRSEYATAKAARLVTLPHWGHNPYRPADNQAPAGGSSTGVSVRAPKSSEAATAPPAGTYHDRRFAPGCRVPWNGDGDTQSPNCWCPQDRPTEGDER